MHKHLEDFCREHGLPLDRARLALRIVRLSGQVRAYDQAVLMLAQTLHFTMHKVPESYVDCPSETCQHARTLLEILRKAGEERE